MSNLESTSALHGFAAPGRYGKRDGDAGVTASERKNLGLATIAARKGQEAALKAAIQSAYGADLPDGSTSAVGKGVRFIGIGPGQWFAVSDSLANEALADELSTKLQGLASIADHSSGRAVMRIEGPAVKDALAKGLAIDLDPRVFVDGAAATSTLSHMGVLLWRDGDAYDVALFRSVGGSFWGWLRASAAEYGLEFVTTS
ncbi:sarcosine oxidase subunit gamma family protein [Methyloceanibacter sp.]|uniref:sarcosine oxidase subunit gamma n=1 Tax=Methyloceanibacter sp. TaxID=1965321 RepID=UPI002C617F8C|nr:sarcosine oxidase subunit gamma family protein [Methyloceanibacter sp.]HML91192.1 sarcosine oxidase subunit gamma family protein [Methyloceanibacter sp.]